MLTLLKPLARLSCRTFLVLSMCSLVKLAAAPVLGSPDIIEISVQHLDDVQEQMREGLGISWGPQQTSVAHVQIGSTIQDVSITRVYSVSSTPYVELIQATPQIGPWAPFNDEFGLRPRSIAAWRIHSADFNDSKNVIANSGMTKTAESADFVYYETAAGIQFQLIRDNLAPDPDNGIANTPPAGKIDFGGMSYMSIPLKPNPLAPGFAVPNEDAILRRQITAASNGGIKWDLIIPIYLYLPYIKDSDPSNPVYLNNPFLRYTCNSKPYLNILVINPDISPWGATAHSTTFSHAWVPSGSGFDPAGTAIFNSYADQLFAAGYQSEIRLDAQSILPLPYSSPFLRYFVGIDGVNIQVVSTPGSNVTSTCTSFGCIGSYCN